MALQSIAVDLPEITDLSNDLMAEKYKELNACKKVITTYMDSVKENLTELVATQGVEELDANGEVKKYSYVIQSNVFPCTLELGIRNTHSINNDQAVYVFEQHGWDKHIDTDAKIELKPKVTPDMVPKEILAEINKYFTISLEKSIKPEIVKDHLSLMTQAEKDSVFVTKQSRVFSVKG